MKIVAFERDGTAAVGLVVDQQWVFDLQSLVLEGSAAGYTFPDDEGRTVPVSMHRLIERWASFRSATEELAAWGVSELDRLMAGADGSGRRVVHGYTEISLLPPVGNPGRIIGVGLNYHGHAKELGKEAPERPILFSKDVNSLTGSGSPIVLPPDSHEVDYEAELALIVGIGGRAIDEKDALNHVGGYTCFNDVSARDHQRADGQWYRGKSHATFGPIGPWLLTADEIPDPGFLAISLDVNGERLQNSNTSELIFDVRKIVSYVSNVVRLEPGDIIATGTPAGVGSMRDPARYLVHGDLVEIEIDGLGRLENPVVSLPS